MDQKISNIEHTSDLCFQFSGDIKSLKTYMWNPSKIDVIRVYVVPARITTQSYFNISNKKSLLFS